MNTLLVPLFLFSFLASTFAQNSSLTINTIVQVVVCEPILLTWSGGVSPYHIFVIPANNLSATLFILGPLNGTEFTWVVNVTAGNSDVLQIHDNTGALADSGPFNPTGSDTSCINSGSTGSSSAGTNPSVSAGTGASTGASTKSSTGAATGSPARSSGSAALPSASGTGVATSTQSSAAAAHHYAPLAILGVAAFFLALVL